MMPAPCSSSFPCNPRSIERWNHLPVPTPSRNPTATANRLHPEVAESAERAKAVAHGAIDRTADAAASAVDAAVSRGAQWRAAQQRLADDAVACMRANPLAAVGLAFGPVSSSAACSAGVTRSRAGACGHRAG